jgi:hypothetical protein
VPVLLLEELDVQAAQELSSQPSKLIFMNESRREYPARSQKINV